MTLSVAMATWNGQRFIRSQLLSIANQSRRPDELVVSDDASTDLTTSIAEQVCRENDLPLVLIRNRFRRGVVPNFEKAIAATTQDIIVLSDQDDVWHPDKLAVLEATFARDDRVGGVFSDGLLLAAPDDMNVTLWSSFGFTRKEQVQARENGMLEVLLRRNVVTGATLAFRASSRGVLLPLGPFGLHDAWIALLLAACSQLEPLPLPLVSYRIHSQNAEGLGVRSPKRAVNQRSSGLQRAEAAQLEALIDRVSTQCPNHTDQLQLLYEKLRHVEFRCELPANPIRRATAIVGSLGRYRRFSSGWRSPLLDLIAPTPAAS